ncbi:MAG: hypothetical protein IKO48_01940 [Elusimicrobia bacterium]|nr:hypothetical protein [Elusimicrobiota bacterium]
MDIKLTTENNVEITLPEEIVKDIKQGLLFEISKKEKDTYTYFSKNTLGVLLFLSKEANSYPLKNLISKNDFAEFYYDLGSTDLKTVFRLDIGGTSANLYKYYDVFLEYQEQVEGKSLYGTMPAEIIDIFYENIKDYYVGLYSTVESLFQFLLFEKYNIKISKKTRTKDDVEDYGLCKFISYEPKFVSNQIADDILKEYIDEFENCKLNEDKTTKIKNPFTNEELAETDKIRKSDLTNEEKNKKLAKFSPKERDADMKGGALLKKEQIINYYNYKKLITIVDDIFGNDYENSGNILNVNNGILLNNQKIAKGDVGKIRLYELLLSLEKNKDIKINKITCKNCDFSVNIEFLKNPKDISSDSANWISYGDLRVNKNLGLGQYKNKPIKKFGKTSNKFKVLCYLIDHPDIVVDVKKLIEITNLTNDFRAYRKIGKSAREIHKIVTERLPKYTRKIKDYTHDIQEDLEILNDKERTIQISQAKPGFILHKTIKI